MGFVLTLCEEVLDVVKVFACVDVGAVLGVHFVDAQGLGK